MRTIYAARLGEHVYHIMPSEGAAHTCCGKRRQYDWTLTWNVPRGSRICPECLVALGLERGVLEMEAES